MPIRAKLGRPQSEAFRYIQALVAEKSDDCQFFGYPIRTVAFGGTSKTPQWISTFLTHGSKPLPELVPVKLCGVVSCINGRHYKWGTQEEAQAGRIFPSRKGGSNPNAKVSDDKLAELRARDWGNGAGKRSAALELGISIKTLNALLKGWSRPDIKPNNGDEF